MEQTYKLFYCVIWGFRILTDLVTHFLVDVEFAISDQETVLERTNARSRYSRN